MKSGRKRIFQLSVSKFVFLVCTGFSLFSGCSGGQDNRLSNYLYVRLKTGPTTLDPAKIVDLDSARIAAKLYSGLVCFNKNLSPVPDIADTWSISPDGLTYTFKLKKNVRFFNGREVTAADFLYSFERVLNPDTRSPRTWVLSRIKGSKQFAEGTTKHLDGVSIKNRYELEITIDEPFAPFISLLGLTTAYVVPSEAAEHLNPDSAIFKNGTGPFVVDQWKHSQFLMLKANENYFGKKPKLSGIQYRIIPEDFTALIEFEKGGIDLLPEIMLSEYSRYAENPEWQKYIQAAPCLNTYYLGLNCQMPPFNDLRVRKALNFAIDREKMLEILLEGRGTSACGPLPPALRKNAPAYCYSYDPDRARKLLQQAGFPDGFSMTIYQTADTENLDICQAIQSYLKNINIDVRIVQLEWSSFLNKVARGEAQSFWLSWWADYPDAENFLFPLFHSANFGPGGNRSRYKNKAVDGLIMQAVKTSNAVEREISYRAAEKIIIEEAPWIFFWHKSSCSINRPGVTGYSPAPLAVMEKWTNVRITQ